MANVNAAFGFRPTMRTLSGAAGSLVPAHKLVGNGTALFINDCVNQVLGGTKPTRCITQGATVVLGVNLIYGAPTKATDHIIVLASGAVFVAAGDGTGALFLTAANLSMNANIAANAGNAGTKISGHAVSETSIANTNTLSLHIRGLYQAPDNVAGQYARVYVSFNNLVDADQKAGA